MVFCYVVVLVLLSYYLQDDFNSRANGLRSGNCCLTLGCVCASTQDMGMKIYNIQLVVMYYVHWYAGVAVPQVLQYLREFDAPVMQSCKPLPCGTGS